MAKKNLGRTILEGGRSNYNKSDRRQSSKNERVRVKAYEKKLTKAADPDDLNPPKKRVPVGKEFTDKLSAVYRWMDAQCGRRWDDVFSDICKRYDTRNLAGRHIVYDHMLREVYGTGLEYGFFRARDDKYAYRWHIDDEGLLQARPKVKKKPFKFTYTPEQLAQHKKWADESNRAAVARFLNTRLVERHGQSYYWQHPHYATRVLGTPPNTHTSKYVSHYERGNRLTPAEKKKFFAFGEEFIKDYLR